MGVLTRENFAELEGVIRTVYDQEMKKKTDYIPMLFNVATSKKSEEKHYGIGSIGKMKSWKGSVTYDTIAKRGTITYRHAKYENGLAIERELLDFEEFAEIKRRTRLISDSVYKTRQDHAASVFNNAFDASVTGGSDNKALCAATHTLSPTDSTVQSNAGTLDLTTTNIFATQKDMYAFKDDRGDRLGINPKLLIVGDYYLKKAKEIVGSDKDPYNAENTVNIYKDELNYLHLPLLEGKKWFLADPDKMQLFLNWYDARKATPEYVEDFDTEVGKYKVVGMWSFGWDEYYFLKGHNVS